jgi:hypothetical protein
MHADGNSEKFAMRMHRERSRAIGDVIARLFHAMAVRIAGQQSKQENAMDPLQGEPAVWIPARTTVMLPEAAQQVVACDAGTIWITQGDGNDYVLTAGQRLALHPRDKVIVSAMAKPARVRYAVARAERDNCGADGGQSEVERFSSQRERSKNIWTQ